MKTNFQIKGIESNRIHHLFSLTDDELSNIKAKRILVDEKPGYPCRISLQEASIGESIIAVPYIHHDVNSPYKASGPIFVRNKVQTAKLEINEVPEILQHRLLSIRAYNSNAMMIDATTAQGSHVEKTIRELFQNILVQYLHIHNANPGCFNCCVERA